MEKIAAIIETPNGNYGLTKEACENMVDGMLQYCRYEAEMSPEKTAAFFESVLEEIESNNKVAADPAIPLPGAQTPAIRDASFRPMMPAPAGGIKGRIAAGTGLLAAGTYAANRPGSFLDFSKYLPGGGENSQAKFEGQYFQNMNLDKQRELYESGDPRQIRSAGKGIENYMSGRPLLDHVLNPKDVKGDNALVEKSIRIGQTQLHNPLNPNNPDSAWSKVRDFLKSNAAPIIGGLGGLALGGMLGGGRGALIGAGLGTAGGLGYKYFPQMKEQYNKFMAPAPKLPGDGAAAGPEKPGEQDQSNQTQTGTKETATNLANNDPAKK